MTASRDESILPLMHLVQQLTPFTCGLACIESVAFDLGSPITQAEILRRYKNDLIGCASNIQLFGEIIGETLIYLLNDLGFKTAVYENCAHDQFRDVLANLSQKQAAIISMKLSKSAWHFVRWAGFQDDNRLLVMNPAFPFARSNLGGVFLRRLRQEELFNCGDYWRVSRTAQLRMNPEEFAQIVRNGSDKLRVDRIVLVDANNENKFTGKGLLRISATTFEIDFTGRGKGWPPQRSTNVVTEKDYWTMSGVIEDQLHFSCNLVNPDGAYRSANGLVTFTRTLHSVELVTKHPDPAKSRRKGMRNIDASGWQFRHGIGPVLPIMHFGSRQLLSSASCPGANAGSQTFVLNDFFPDRKSGVSKTDTFLGEISGGQYALIRAKNRLDLEMYLRSQPCFESGTYGEDQRKCHVWLQAVAFVTGVQPWPCRMKYSRGTYLMSDTIRAAERPPRTIYSAFSSGFGHEHAKDLRSSN